MSIQMELFDGMMNGRHKNGQHNGSATKGIDYDAGDVVDLDVDSLDRYRGIDAICGRYKKVSREYENLLCERAQNGCLRSRDFLVTNNLGFIVAELIKKFPRMDYHELLSSAVFGMNEAIKRYDVSSNVRLLSYANAGWLHFYSREQVHNDKTIREPSNHPQYRKRINERMRDTGESFNEAGKSLGHEDLLLNTVEREMVSIDSPLDETDANSKTLADVLVIDEPEMPLWILERDELRWQVQSVVATLTAEEQELVTRVFGLNGKEPEKYETIGNDLGITRQGVQSRLKTIMMKLTRKFTQRGIDRSVLEVA